MQAATELNGHVERYQPPVAVIPPTFLESRDIGEVAAALVEAQKKMKAATKDREVNVTSQKTGRSWKSEYATYSAVHQACLPALNECGIALQHYPSTASSLVTVATRLLHKSGQWLACSITMVPQDQGPQAIGSCITYAKRYTLEALAGIRTEDDETDDDGEMAEGRNTPPVNKAATVDPKSLEERLLAITVALNDAKTVTDVNAQIATIQSLPDGNAKDRARNAFTAAMDRVKAQPVKRSAR